MLLGIYRRIKKNAFSAKYNQSPLSIPRASYISFHGQGGGYSTSWGNRRQGEGDRRQGAGDNLQRQVAIVSTRQAGGVRQGGSGFFPSLAASAEFPAVVKPEQRQGRTGGSISCITPFSCTTPYCSSPSSHTSPLSPVSQISPISPPLPAPPPSPAGCETSGGLRPGGSTWALDGCGRGVCAVTLAGEWAQAEER